MRKTKRKMIPTIKGIPTKKPLTNHFHSKGRKNEPMIKDTHIIGTPISNIVTRIFLGNIVSKVILKITNTIVRANIEKKTPANASLITIKEFISKLKNYGRYCK